MLDGIYAYNTIYSLLNISSRDLKNTSASPASLATSMIFGTSLNDKYRQLIDYDAYSSQSEFYGTFRSKLGDLKESAGALSNAEQDDLATRQANYDTNAITAKVKDNAEVASYEIEVEQVASKQVNQSAEYFENSDVTLDESANHIEIRIDDEVTDLLIERSPDASYETLFESIADSVNQNVKAVTASVTNDNGLLQLQISSRESGEASQFEIGGNLSEALGLNNITQAAQDSIVRVNEAILTSTSNLIELDNGKVGIQVNQETVIPFELYIDVSGVGALSTAKKFANSFNEAMIYLQGLNNIQSDLLRKQILQSATDSSDAFEAVGMEMTDDYALSIDEEKFLAQFESETPEAKRAVEAFQKTVKTVSNKASQALRTPPSTYKPASMPQKLQSSSFNYSQNMTPIAMNTLFSKGSIVDVFF